MHNSPSAGVPEYVALQPLFLQLVPTLITPFFSEDEISFSTVSSGGTLKVGAISIFSAFKGSVLDGRAFGAVIGGAGTGAGGETSTGAETDELVSLASTGQTLLCSPLVQPLMLRNSEKSVLNF